MKTHEGLDNWRLPNGERVFYTHLGKIITSAGADRYFGIYGRSWFSVRWLKGQWWLYYVVAEDFGKRVKIEMPATQEEALGWMRMVVEMSGIKQEGTDENARDTGAQLR